MSIVTNLKSAAATTKTVLKKHAPDILVGTGVVSMGGAGVVACKNTLKLEETMDENEKLMEKASQSKDKNDTLKAKFFGAMNIAKLYAAPVAMFIGGAAMVFGGHSITKKRLAGVTMAYGALNDAYNKYRSNVRKAEGDDADYCYAHDIDPHNLIEVKNVNPETGEEEVTKAICSDKPLDPNNLGIYTYYVSPETCSMYIADPWAMKTALAAALSFARNKFNMNRSITMREILQIYHLFEYYGKDKDDLMLTGYVKNQDKNADQEIYTDIKEVWYGPTGEELKSPNFIIEFNCPGLLYGKLDTHSNVTKEG